MATDASNSTVFKVKKSASAPPRAAPSRTRAHTRTRTCGCSPAYSRSLRRRPHADALLSKVFSAWHIKTGTAVGSFKFMLDNRALNELDTVKQAEIEQDDEIEAFTNQTGGC
jgi:hypothetical protein